jgi:hypothetical protein
MWRIRTKATILLILWHVCPGALTLALPALTTAAIVLDQSNVVPDTPPNNIIGGINGANSRAQSFIVGITGDLVGIGLQLQRFSPSLEEPLTVQLRHSVGGLPDLGPVALLAEISVPASSVPVTGLYDFLEFDLGSEAFSVTAGEELAIVLSKGGGGQISDSYGWAISTANTYEFGIESRRLVAFDPEFVEDSFDGQSVDAGFQTFVSTTSSFVPESTSLVIWSILAGVGLIDAARRSKLRAA